MTYFPSHAGETEVNSQTAFDNAVQALNVRDHFKIEAESLEAKVWANDHLPMYVWATDPSATYNNIGFGAAPHGGIGFLVLGGHLSAQELVEGPRSVPSGLVHTQSGLLAEIQHSAPNYVGAGANFIADAQNLFSNSQAFAPSAHTLIVEDFRPHSFISLTTKG